MTKESPIINGTVQMLDGDLDTPFFLMYVHSYYNKHRFAPKHLCPAKQQKS